MNIEYDDYIVFYSKYSSYSKQLLELVKNQVPDIIEFCVDNSKVRKILKKSTDIKLRVVPSILILNGTSITKYEGKECFELVNSISVNDDENQESEEINEVNDEGFEMIKPKQSQPIQPMQSPINGHFAQLKKPVDIANIAKEIEKQRNDLDEKKDPTALRKQMAQPQIGMPTFTPKPLSQSKTTPLSMI